VANYFWVPFDCKKCKLRNLKSNKIENGLKQRRTRVAKVGKRTSKSVRVGNRQLRSIFHGVKLRFHQNCFYAEMTEHKQWLIVTYKATSSAGRMTAVSFEY